MRFPRIRLVANTIVFGGWILPAVLARLVPEQVGAVADADPASMFNLIAGLWGIAAAVYGVVLALRVRRSIRE